MKIVIIGANGFLGRALMKYFLDTGNEVVAVARRREGCLEGAQFYRWDGESLGAWVDGMEGAKAVVNLAGRSVNCRYNEENRKAIMESRTQTTVLIGEAIQGLKDPPEVWVNSSTATIYKHREQGGGRKPHTERDGVVGDDFSMGVAKAWEQAFFGDDKTPIRKVAARTAIVLGAERKMVFDKLSDFVKLGLGGKMGSGKQMFSWIHEYDFCRAIEWMIQSEMTGCVNVVAPKAATNAEFMKTLRSVWNKPFGLPATKWMLELGTFLLKSETELVLKSRWVYPERLLEEGFQFKLGELERACAEIRGRL